MKEDLLGMRLLLILCVCMAGRACGSPMTKGLTLRHAPYIHNRERMTHSSGRVCACPALLATAAAPAPGADQALGFVGGQIDKMKTYFTEGFQRAKGGFTVGSLFNWLPGACFPSGNLFPRDAPENTAD